MNTFTFAFAVAILTTASAQTYSLGNCNNAIQKMNNFNRNRYSGTWYIFERSLNSAENGTKCFSCKFVLDTDNPYNEVSFLTEDGTQHNITYILKNVRNASFTFTPGYITDHQIFSILDTDYENYSVVHSCLDSYHGKIEYVWLTSKKVNPETKYIEKAEAVLRERRIGLELIPVTNNC